MHPIGQSGVSRTQLGPDLGERKASSHDEKQFGFFFKHLKETSETWEDNSGRTRGEGGGKTDEVQ